MSFEQDFVKRFPEFADYELKDISLSGLTIEAKDAYEKLLSRQRVKEAIEKEIEKLDQYKKPDKASQMMICWACYEDEYCEHDIKIDALKDLLQSLGLDGEKVEQEEQEVCKECGSVGEGNCPHI